MRLKLCKRLVCVVGSVNCESDCIIGLVKPLAYYLLELERIYSSCVTMVLLSLKPIPFLPKAMEMLFDKSLLGLLIESSLHLLRSRLRLFLVVPPPVSSPLIPRRGEPVRNWKRTLISSVFWKTSSIWSKYWSAVRCVCLDSDRSLC